MLRLAWRIGLAIAAAFVVYFGVTFVQVWHASRTDRARPAQAIVVLGAAQYNGTPSGVLRDRLDHALELYRKGIAPVVVVTGGNQPGDRFTEASTSASFLIRAGVPERSLRLESHGRTSWESLAAAARFLRKEGISHVVLVSSPWHALRTEQIAGVVGLHGRASPAKEHESLALHLEHLGRETLAVGIGRIIGPRRLVNLDVKVKGARKAG